MKGLGIWEKERGRREVPLKIHACKNDCVLFWKENVELEACPVCKESRWQDLNDGADKSVEDASSEACTSKKKRLPTLLSSYP